MTADATLPASDDLTPEVLARWEELAGLTDEQRALLTAPDARMEAYYFSFERTGIPEIDAILSALAYAGKGQHSTEGWGDPEHWVAYGPFAVGQSYADVIQAASNDAARSHAALLSGVRSRDARIAEAECERDHYRLMMAEAKVALAYAAERLDEFSYSELASAIDDEWCDEQTGAPTASRTLARVKAEAWYECRQAVYELNGGDDRIDAELSASNPYRKAAGQ